MIAAMGAVMQYDDGLYGYLLNCGVNEADEAIVAAEHEPNGYFWEGVARFLQPDLVDRLDLDPEADMFVARGSKADVEALQEVLDPLAEQSAVVAEVIERAQAAGFEFDD